MAVESVSIDSRSTTVGDVMFVPSTADTRPFWTVPFRIVEM
jgi:hypothetical protein